jgi:hypothetical protein
MQFLKILLNELIIHEIEMIISEKNSYQLINKSSTNNQDGENTVLNLFVESLGEDFLTRICQGAKYLVFVSSSSLKTREKYTIRDNLVCRNLYIFWAQSHLCLLLQNTFFCIDGSVLKKYTNWDKLSCLILYIFLLFWGNERRQKPNISHPR